MMLRLLLLAGALLQGAQACTCAREDFARDLAAAALGPAPLARATVLNSTTREVDTFFSATSAVYALRVHVVYGGACGATPFVARTVAPLRSSCTRTLSVGATYIIALNPRTPTLTILCSTVVPVSNLTPAQSALLRDSDPCRTPEPEDPMLSTEPSPLFSPEPSPMFSPELSPLVLPVHSPGV